jgi:exodeoxyribonuclease V alpha subunit
LNESSYTQAFALSVHKSQGSEYQRVLFMIPQGSERFSLEIIYTAITRVKQTLFMWFDKEPLKEAFSKRNLRYSGLRHRCKN